MVLQFRPALEVQFACYHQLCIEERQIGLVELSFIGVGIARMKLRDPPERLRFPRLRCFVKLLGPVPQLAQIQFGWAYCYLYFVRRKHNVAIG